MSDSLALAVRGRRLRLVFMALLVLPTAYWAMSQVFIIFRPNEFRVLEWVQLCLASTLFLWLSMAFWTAIIGFLLTLFNRDPLTFQKIRHHPKTEQRLTKKHAIIMPVYNEDTARIIAGFEAAVREMARIDLAKIFDFYMLSDSQDKALIQAEKNAWAHLLQRLPDHVLNHCFYRHRANNIGRKVGNVKDFCQRWGYQYDTMIVLDADSIMTGEKMYELAQRMEYNPQVGLIQTVPMPVRQTTFFGRFVQFAAHVYSPMLATGLSFWQGDCANYWGHNAIIRVQAFLDTCGLPKLKGRKPFGGDILSHDFVEAALLRRAGWQVFLLTDSQGSYEEVPSNIIDYATRDRRWVQGNMQHLALIATRGLHLANRLHFGFGAFAYGSSILLLLMLIVGTVDAVIQAFTTPVYFTQAYQLFPTWLITEKNVMITTLWVTIALLFLPKVLGILITFIQRRQAFGGGFNFLKSAFLEFFFAVLIAPIMMIFHSYFVLNVLAGKSVSWEAQAREGRMIPWLQACKFSFLLMLIGMTWASVTFLYTKTLFYWLLPVFSGLVLSVFIIRLSSSTKLGLWCRNIGLLVIQSELRPQSAIRQIDRNARRVDITSIAQNTPALPQELWREMPDQKVSRGIYAKSSEESTLNNSI